MYVTETRFLEIDCAMKYYVDLSVVSSISCLVSGGEHDTTQVSGHALDNYPGHVTQDVNLKGVRQEGNGLCAYPEIPTAPPATAPLSVNSDRML